MKRSILQNISVSLNRVYGIQKNIIAKTVNSNRPITHRIILFESFNGTRINCSPLAIYENLRIKYPGQYIYVWAVTDPSRYSEYSSRSDTIICEYLSDLHRMYSYTARVVISNCVRDASLPTRDGQIRINTWHGGGCYKTVGIGQKGSNALRNAFYRHRMNQWDYFLSSCKLFSDIEIRKQMGYKGSILPWGLPRNDCLVNCDESDTLSSREHLNIPKDRIAVLVAPTFRSEHSVTPMPDVDIIRTAIETRFNRRSYIMFRGHSASNAEVSLDGFDCNLSSIEDTQVVLRASDVLITDYSSIVWDYSLLHRPLFLFIADLKEYNENRGFCIPPEDWGFPISRTNQELQSSIENFDSDKFEQSINHHHLFFGSYETGESLEKTCELIHSNCCGG